MSVISLVRALRTQPRRVVRALNRLLVRYSRSNVVCLIVAREPDGRKVSRLVERLQYYCDPVRLEGGFRVVQTATLPRLLLSRSVLEADEGLVPSRYRHRLDNVFNVDFDRSSEDGWELCRLSQVLAGLPTQRRREEAHARLRNALERILTSGRRKVYVFGTGPSLEAARGRDFSDGYVIVSNTIVRDAALWHQLRPDFIVAADAIYHFGHTAHARAFRADLKARLAESNGATFFAYPELFDAIAQREFPELQDLLIPIPMGSHDHIHVNLLARFELPALGNVLNVLLLPLACTLSNSVWLWGFDGRAPDDKLFWSNSRSHSYPEFVAELRDEHPAFFATWVPKGRERDYVSLVHGDALDQRLERAENEGFEFVMMHFSWTETLNKRSAAFRAKSSVGSNAPGRAGKGRPEE